MIRRNPCRIAGAGMPATPERQMIPLTKVVEILAMVPERYRALVLLGTFASLRWGELAGLRRSHLDLDGERFASSARSPNWTAARVACGSAYGRPAGGDHP